MRIFGAGLVALLIASFASAQRPREPWEWTLEERVRARLAHVNVNGKIDGNAQPELLYPEHLFEALVRNAFVHSHGAAFTLSSGMSSIDILTTPEEWERFAAIADAYAAALARRTNATSPEARVAGEQEVKARELCLLRNDALERARQEFGRVEFDRFLYRTRGGHGTSWGRDRPEATEENVAQEMEFLTNCVPPLPRVPDSRLINPTDSAPPPPPAPRPERRITTMDRCNDHGGNTPLVLDFQTGAYRVSTLDEGVTFDFDGDGMPTATGWPADTEGVAFLVLDRNGNGRIDDGTELLANSTPLEEGRSHGGLWYLQAFDCNKDGVVTKDDRGWCKLGLWHDIDRNGVVNEHEIVSLDNAGVLALEPAGFQWVGRGDFNGNLTMNRGWFHFLVDGVPRRRAMFEICLARPD